ncbi:MAG: response regulator [Alphaproteobacteria bacterium CG_4_9_14_3_um_filter_47_13]|nr:MAG: response regulator [Alphaproteobacteria bacterium CG_4_9_14_3_um_filter_47_13]
MAKILIAEDDSSMRHFLAMALERAGHDVNSCEDGLSALRVLEAEGQDFDLLLADIVMPGMDGIELSQKASKISDHLKIMFITGFAGVALGNRNPGHEKARVLSKPFHLKELVDQVEELLAA